MKKSALIMTFLMAAGAPIPSISAKASRTEAESNSSNDPYAALAAKLAERAAKKLSEKKIAVLPFDAMDGRQTPGSRVVAEKLTNRLVQQGDFVVIERGMVEKIMKELEFQNSAAVDADTAKKLGKGLGVEAIITGTLEEQSDGTVEVDARVIKTESFEIIAAASETIENTWAARQEPPQQTFRGLMGIRKH